MSESNIVPPRLPRLKWACFLLVWSVWGWVLMLLTHELGHIVIAWLTRGVVTATNLWPGALAYTLISPNPSPHWVAWGGVIVGCMAPLSIWLVVKCLWRDVASLRGLAGFCLLANGSYLAAGGQESLTDTGVLLNLGWPLSVLIAVGVTLANPGYRLCRYFLMERYWAQPSWRELAWMTITWCGWVVLQAMVVTSCHMAG